ncbi:MAG: hypothetical protein ACI4BA_00200 [Prevotella sp.]
MKKAYIKPEIISVNVETATLLAGSVLSIDASSTNTAGQRIGGFGEELLDDEEW